MRLSCQFAQGHFGMLFGITLRPESGITQTRATVFSGESVAAITTITSVKATTRFVTKARLVATRTTFAIAAITRSACGCWH